MTTIGALAGFAAIAVLVTITPGPDSLLVLRTALAEGPRRARAAGLGICAGLLLWGGAVALGLAALLAAAPLAYDAVQLAGAAYLIGLGLRLLVAPASAAGAPPESAGGHAFRRGLLTNLTNPKIGVFYLSLLPQLMPDGAPLAPLALGMAAIHAATTAAWVLVLTAGTRAVAGWAAAPHRARALDRLCGAVLAGCGLRLVLERV